MASKPDSIIIVAPDLGLRQSLMFALEVEGFKVNAYEKWKEGHIPKNSIVCLIVDEQALTANKSARRYLANVNRTVILLTSGLTGPIVKIPGVTTLMKPFNSPELLNLIGNAALVL